jgi:hypothetical protein
VDLLSVKCVEAWPTRRWFNHRITLLSFAICHSKRSVHLPVIVADLLAGWPIMAYALIGREDVAATLASNDTAAAASSCVVDALPSSGKAVDATTVCHPQQQQQQQRLQHLLLPYEQRLLLPNSCGLTGQQLNSRPLSGATQASGKAAAAAAAARRASARPWGRGLRGSSAAAAAGAAAAGASGAFGAGIGQSTNAQNTGELGLPIDGMEGIAGEH